MPLPSSSGRSTRSIGSEISDLHELLVAELISSAWWNPQTYPIAEAAIGELDLDALHGGLGSEILLSATIAIYEFRLALRRELTVGLARRSLASGNLLASSPIAFLYAVVTLFRSGCSTKQLPSSTRRSRRPAGADIFNLAFLLTWRGVCQTDRGDLRAAVADLREAIELLSHGTRLNWSYNIGFLAYALLSRARRTRQRESSTKVASQSATARPVHLVWFRSTAPVCASRPEAPSGASRSCARSARPFGCFHSTIQAPRRGVAGPLKGFDVSIGTTRRVCSPPTSSRSLDAGVTRRPSAPPCACARAD